LEINKIDESAEADDFQSVIFSVGKKLSNIIQHNRTRLHK